MTTSSTINPPAAPSASTPPPVTTPDAGPLPHLRIEAHKGWQPVDFREIWRYRELLGFLAMRDIKVRYKQTVLGVVWVVLQPLLQTGIFAFIFGKVAKVTPESIPPAVFIFSSMLVYQLAARTLGQSSNSLVSNAGIIKKIYFPRLIYPLAPILSGMVDFAVGLVVLGVLMAITGVMPSWTLLAMPVFVALAALCGLAFGLSMAALNVAYRDVGFLVPFLAQIWMYVSPVVFSIEKIKNDWPRLYPFFLLNPLTGIVEGFRWSVLGGAKRTAFPAMELAVGLPILFVILLFGLAYFRRMEKTFADIV